MNNKAIHLLWLTENFPPARGGMAQSCDRIVYGLRKTGFNVHIIHFCNRKEPYKTDIIVNGTYTAIPVFENEAHTANLCWNFVNRMPYPFSKIVSFGGYLPLLTGPVYSKWLDIPLITMLRGNDFDTTVFNPRRKPSLDEAMIASESVGCVAKDQLIKLKKLYPGLHALYTPNGINIVDWQVLPSEEKFAEQWRADKINGRICLGVFGQVKEKKGLEILLHCLSKPIHSDDYFLLIAGDCEESLKDTLIGLGIRYELLPFMDRNELVKYYAVCDAVIIPSHYEGMPNVLLEAGALGIPVIASAVGGMKDILSLSNESFLFPPGDHDQLDAILFKFKEMRKEERVEEGRKLKNNIIDNFNSEMEMKPYLEIFIYDKNHNKKLV